MWPRADPDVLHKGFGLAAVRSPGFLEGAILDWRAGGPNAAQPELITVSTTYIRR
jgi:hypothetical protein